jgi:hypothetical protein
MFILFMCFSSGPWGGGESAKINLSQPASQPSFARFWSFGFGEEKGKWSYWPCRSTKLGNWNVWMDGVGWDWGMDGWMFGNGSGTFKILIG